MTLPFDYDLPAELIAQEPMTPRDQARLLVVQRRDGSLAHQRFVDLPDLLAPGDLLVLNDTRVVPARLLGHRLQTGGKWEGLFLRLLPDGAWEMLCQTRGRLPLGETVEIRAGRAPHPQPLSPEGRGEHGDLSPLRLRLDTRLSRGLWRVKALSERSTWDLLDDYGHMPLPPYIRKGQDRPADRDRYQTVFARCAGAVAAPTAGLHFTPQLFERLKERGIDWTFITLHVGLGTFQPIQAEDFTEHPMHREWGELSADAARAIVDCRKRRGRVVAVGTTSVRVLETVAQTGPVRPWSGETELFIYPPYDFKVVDALITNFHLPRTTLLLLVCALAGVEWTKKAYLTAIQEKYRFYSYGDAMLIV